MLCPQCQAPVTKNTLNEHFVNVHGRKAAVAGQSKPSQSAPKASQSPKQARPPGHKTEKQTPVGPDAAAESAADPDTVLAMQIKKEIEEGILRCPDCGKKLTREKLSAHYQQAHQQRKVYKGKRGKERPSNEAEDTSSILDAELHDQGG